MSNTSRYALYAIVDNFCPELRGKDKNVLEINLINARMRMTVNPTRFIEREEKTQKSLPIKFLFFLGYSILVCVLIEFAVRIKFRAWPFERRVELPSWCTEKDRNLRWRFSPKDGRNSLGLRSAEIGPKEKFRILFLGDSVLWGIGYHTKVIEDNLNVEVINAGVPGYTTYQELEFLKAYGLDMNPDLVIIGFALNDVYYPYLSERTSDKLHISAVSIQNNVSWSV
jgi:hypothetical protein